MKLKYIKLERDYWYYRRGAFRRKLRGKPGDPNFMVDYAQAHAEYEAPGKPVKTADQIIVERTFRSIAVPYYASQEFLGLAAETQRQYRRYGDFACEVFGGKDERDIKMSLVLSVRDEMDDRPAAANEFCKVVRIIFGWGLPRDLASHNPADFRGTSVKKLKGGEWLPWPEEALTYFLENTQRAVREVMLNCLFTGQRISDVIAMMKSHIRHYEPLNKLYVKQKKTGKELLIPLHEDFQAVLDEIDNDSTHLHVSRKGTVWTYDNWYSTFCREKERLGVTKYVIHGLRKNAVIRLLLAGCTTQEAGSITGQTDEIVSYYARKIDQEKLVDTAMKRLSDWTNKEQNSGSKVVNLRSGEN